MPGGGILQQEKLIAVVEHYSGSEVIKPMVSPTTSRRSFVRDVVVVGYGVAGAVSAIEAADHEGDVLLIEKAPHLGGLTALSGGFMRVASDSSEAARYLEEASGGKVEKSLVETLADGMTKIPNYLNYLGQPLAAKPYVSAAKPYVSIGEEQKSYETADLYNWSGWRALGWAGFPEVPDFNGYPWLHGRNNGQNLMRVLEENVHTRGVDVWYNCQALRLISDDGKVVGITVDYAGGEADIFTRGGVILACGGFEFDPGMLRDFMELPCIFPVGHPYNTGDGIKMAQELGADLWHMWHVHGSYGFKFNEHSVALRNHLGGGRREARKVAWILVDQNGNRFTNEVHPAPQDTGWRALNNLNTETGNFDQVPSWMIFDEEARKLGPVAKTTPYGLQEGYEWSEDNLKEVEKGWIIRAETLSELAEKTQLPQDTLIHNIEKWNRSVSMETDCDFGRPPGTMTPVKTPPFFAVQVWPVCSNTQGGPKHDHKQRVVNAYGNPIPNLYAVGELGSFFGHIYLLGGNLSEGVVGGRIAGQMATQQARDGVGTKG